MDARALGTGQAGLGRLAKKLVGRPGVQDESHLLVLPWHEKGSNLRTGAFRVDVTDNLPSKAKRPVGQRSEPEVTIKGPAESSNKRRASSRRSSDSESVISCTRGSETRPR